MASENNIYSKTLFKLQMCKYLLALKNVTTFMME